jgi:hypothetical protein
LYGGRKSVIRGMVIGPKKTSCCRSVRLWNSLQSKAIELYPNTSSPSRMATIERASAAPVLVWRGMLRRMKTKERPNSKRSAPSRSIWIGSHRTSVRLEPTMWAALNDISAERGKTAHDVILEIDRGRKGIT